MKKSKRLNELKKLSILLSNELIYLYKYKITILKQQEKYIKSLNKSYGVKQMEQRVRELNDGIKCPRCKSKKIISNRYSSFFKKVSTINWFCKGCQYEF